MINIKIKKRGSPFLTDLNISRIYNECIFCDDSEGNKCF
jgi:hypothetical protein